MVVVRPTGSYRPVTLAVVHPHHSASELVFPQARHCPPGSQSGPAGLACLAMNAQRSDAADGPLPLTGERTVPGLAVENYWFRRHEVAYLHCVDICAGRDVLEAGCGEGYLSLIHI